MRRLLDLGQRRTQLLQAREVGLVADPTPDVVEGKLAHLALDPRTVDGDGSDRVGAQRCDHSGDHPVVELDAAELGEDWALPRSRQATEPAVPHASHGLGWSLR